MPSLTSVLESYLKDTKEALGVAVVDMQTGLLIGVAHNSPGFTETHLDAAAAASVDFFRGKTVSSMEKMLTGLRGSLVRDMIREAQITTDETLHFMVTSRAKPDVLAVLITSRAGDIMAGWTAVRKLLTAAAPYCP